MSGKQATGQKVVSKNKKAFHDYHIDQTFEAGIVLNGPEVKSLRAGKANLRDGYAQIKDGELFLYNVHISPYSFATHISPDPLRVRKLLLHRREIRKLIGKLHEKGIALIPLKIYFIASGKAKVELALARGKKLYDKRAALKEKDSNREIERSMRRSDKDS
jgi:SsrA-binding protein